MGRSGAGRLMIGLKSLRATLQSRVAGVNGGSGRWSEARPWLVSWAGGLSSSIANAATNARLNYSPAFS